MSTAAGSCRTVVDPTSVLYTKYCCMRWLSLNPNPTLVQRLMYSWKCIYVASCMLGRLLLDFVHSKGKCSKDLADIWLAAYKQPSSRFPAPSSMLIPCSRLLVPFSAGQPWPWPACPEAHQQCLLHSCLTTAHRRSCVGLQMTLHTCAQCFTTRSYPPKWSSCHWFALVKACIALVNYCPLLCPQALLTSCVLIC